MAPSSSSPPSDILREAGGKSGGAGRNHRFIVRLDRAVLVALVAGLALYVMPFWAEGRLRAAFWLTLIATLLHVYTSHKRGALDRGPAAAGPGCPVRPDRADPLANASTAPGDRP